MSVRDDADDNGNRLTATSLVHTNITYTLYKHINITYTNVSLSALALLVG